MKNSTTANAPDGQSKNEDFFEAFERLMLATEAKNDAGLATKLGVSAQSVSQAKKKRQIPPQWFIEVAKGFNKSSDWLLFGRGASESGKPEGDGQAAVYGESGYSDSYYSAGVSDRPAEAPYGHWHRAPGFEQPVGAEDSNAEIVMIPMVEARLSAGHGSFETGDNPDGCLAFRRDFLSRKGQVGRMVLMRVDGDSMEPEIKNGDIVLIDQSQTQPRPGMIYAVSVEDMVYLKVVNAVPGKVILTSFNNAYDPLEIDTRGDLAESVRILGRAVWSSREW